MHAECEFLNHPFAVRFIDRLRFEETFINPFVHRLKRVTPDTAPSVQCGKLEQTIHSGALMTEAASGLKPLCGLAAMILRRTCVQIGQSGQHPMQRAELVTEILCHSSDRACRSWRGRRATRQAQSSSPPLLTQQSTPGGHCHPVTVLLQPQSSRLHRHTDKTCNVLDPKPGPVIQPQYCCGIRGKDCTDTQTVLVMYLTPNLT